jgi:hypothetical protein
MMPMKQVEEAQAIFKDASEKNGSKGLELKLIPKVSPVATSLRRVLANYACSHVNPSFARPCTASLCEATRTCPRKRSTRRSASRRPSTSSTESSDLLPYPSRSDLPSYHEP